MVDRTGIREECGVTDDVLTVVDWAQWQSYRSDRGQPPWVKVYRRLQRNPKWVSLSDGQRGQLVSVWLLAADHDGTIEAPAGTLVAFIERVCALSDPLDLEALTAAGFLLWNQGDANTTPTRRQGDAKVTPQKQSTETEAEVETEVVEIQIAAADNAHAREDGWPASPPPMSSGAAGGPNAGPTRKQLDAIASYADELNHVPPVPRTRAEASRLLDELRIEVDELKAETEHQRAKRLETARESGRLQGKVDGRHQQAADATQEMVERIQGRRR